MELCFSLLHSESPESSAKIALSVREYANNPSNVYQAFRYCYNAELNEIRRKVLGELVNSSVAEQLIK